MSRTLIGGGMMPQAVSTGVIRHLRRDDYICSTYRDHVHALSKDVPAREIMAELFGKKTGICRGQGGSMHMFSSKYNLVRPSAHARASVLLRSQHSWQTLLAGGLGIGSSQSAITHTLGSKHSLAPRANPTGALCRLLQPRVDLSGLAAATQQSLSSRHTLSSSAGYA